MLKKTAISANVIFILATASPARATAGGPDFWNVAGVSAGDFLRVHTQSNASSKTIGRLPHDAKGLKNLGCTGLPTFKEWTAMSPAERERRARARWCRISFDGKTGWVAGRYLEEGSGRSAHKAGAEKVGPWSLRCVPGCLLEQVGAGTSRRTLLRLEPDASGNATITIERISVPKTGTFSIYMDGDTIAGGPVAVLAAKGGKQLVMQPDDVTLGLIKQMKTHHNMVVSFPGEERGVEIHLDRFAEAWARVTAARKRD